MAMRDGRMARGVSRAGAWVAFEPWIVPETVAFAFDTIPTMRLCFVALSSVGAKNKTKRASFSLISVALASHFGSSLRVA